MVILVDRNKPFAEIRPLPQKRLKQKRIELGLLADLVGPIDDFFATDKEIESDFLTSGIVAEGKPE